MLFVLIGPDQVTAYITASSALIGGALAVGKFFFWDSAQGARVYENVQKNPMESLSGHFARLIGKSRWPVVFLIDELDRCTDAQVVDLLDSIQTLVRDAPLRHGKGSSAPYFVVAADGAWIRQSYELAHERMTEAVAEPGRPLGHLFLAKLFQLTVPMPSLSEPQKASYFQRLLTSRWSSSRPPEQPVGAQIADRLPANAKEADVLGVLADASPEERELLAPRAVGLMSTPEAEHETKEHVLSKFAPLLEANPRAIKRLIVSYGIERSVRTLEGNLVPRDTLVLWTILRTPWPQLGEHLTNHPDDLKLVGPRRKLPDGTPQWRAALFRDPAVAQVVSFPEGGPLTPARIRECAGTKIHPAKVAH